MKLVSWAGAFQLGMRAVESSDDKQNAFYNLAALFASRNDAGNVERSLRFSSLWAPAWFKPHWALARVLLATGHVGEAGQEAARAADLNGRRNVEVLQTLQEVSVASERLTRHD